MPGLSLKMILQRPTHLTPLVMLTLLLLTMSVSSCGTTTAKGSALVAAKPKERSSACISLPTPDFSDPRCVADKECWQRNYNVKWHRLGCDKTTGANTKPN